VIEYSHRDHRAHRDVGRGFSTLAAAVLALTAVALGVPYAVVGLAAVVGLGVVGVGYLAWSERMLARYSSDLRLSRDRTRTDGFLRAEMANPVGLPRVAGGGAPLSPHARRRYPGAGGAGDGSFPPAESDSDQA
jgi:hypothetical protein